jgi:hypothetical protein
LPIGDFRDPQRHEGATEKIRRLVIARCGDDPMPGERKRSSTVSKFCEFLADLSDSWPMWLLAHSNVVLFYRQIQAIGAWGAWANETSERQGND